MVSLWPWKVDDTASFEKALSALTSKISKAGVKLNILTTRKRRFKALWTLYTTLAYALSLVVLILITGWQKWSVVEYGVVAGSPLIIYSVRICLDRYYIYRLSSAQAYLDDLNQQRSAAIEKFKNATKYSTTQKLLEKYGAAPQSPSNASILSANVKSDPKQHTRRVERTGIAPPPTANIPRPIQNGTPSSISAREMSLEIRLPGASSSAEFAPNAFGPSPRDLAFPSAPSLSTNSRFPQAQPQYQNAPRWYDRLLDVLLGEDETKAANRLALICNSCRLVNGQAPPGTQHLEDIGRWRCSGCNIWNGVDGEFSEMIKAVGGSETNSPTTNRRDRIDKDGVTPTDNRVQQVAKDKLDGFTDGVSHGLTEVENVELQDFENDLEDHEEEIVGDANGTSKSSGVMDTPSIRSTRSRTKKSKTEKRVASN